MKRIILGMILSLSLVATLFSSLTLSAAEPEPFGTTRTSVVYGKTYTISTKEELTRFSDLSHTPFFLDYSGVTILLTDNIVYDPLSDPDWFPVFYFRGIFDGAGHTVVLYCTIDTEIGFISSNFGTVKNLTVDGSICNNASNYLGGIAAVNFGTILNCHNKAEISSFIGALGLGGIVGDNYNTVINCSNSGAINGNYARNGGIAGYNSNSGKIINCYNTGSITNGSRGGGIAGLNYSSGTIINCYNTGTVSSATIIGGISACNEEAVVQNCYWLNSSVSDGIGISYLDTAENVVSFNTSGVLASEVDGETDLLKVLNNWVVANQTDTTGYFGWKTDASYPGLSPEPIITTDSLNSEFIYTPYSVTLSAISAAPVTWTLASGALPAGLMLSTNGILSGTPSTGGTFNFTVQAENDCGVCTKTLSLQVFVQQISLSITDVPTTVSYGDTFTVGTSGGSGAGAITLGISNETDLEGNPTTSVATVSSSGLVTTLKTGTFQITAVKAGDDIYTECSAISGIITVNKKSVTITGIGSADKNYDGSNTAVITGLNTAVITGKLAGDDVSIDSENAIGNFSDSTAGNNKTVNFSGFALTGADADKYILASQPPSVTAKIRKANPDYLLPGFLTATEGQTLTDIKLPADTNGVFTFDDPLTTSVGTPGEHNFNVTFTPYDTLNYKIETIIVVINVKAAAVSSSVSSVASKPSSSGAAQTSSETNSTASDVTAPQMGSPVSYLPLLLFALFSAAGFILFKFRKSKTTK